MFQVIKVENLSIQYGSLKVLEKFNYVFHPNDITVLYGPSGCGKTTLLNAIAGTISYEGLIKAKKPVSYIFQEDRLLPWMSVYENIAYVLDNSIDEESKYDKVMHNLTLVGLADQKDAYPSQLSGGMKRRVSIARAFAFPGEILLMDEPFKGLDKALKEQIMSDFLKIWENDKRSVIFVTHDENEANFIGHKILHLKGLPMEIIHEKQL
ncbi:MAG: ABC transporter ATP-binding protein [Clostridia bacterium]|nr:ABC transporter ATP-binding protein [Clostridia bacterium]